MQLKDWEQPDLAHRACCLARLVDLGAPQSVILIQLALVLDAASRIYDWDTLAQYGIEVLP